MTNPTVRFWLPEYGPERVGGPYSFRACLARWLEEGGAEVTGDSAEPDIDAALAISFIESRDLRRFKRRGVPIVLRLDGIPFRTEDVDFDATFARIRRAYEVADGVILQSDFCLRAVEKNFGPPGCARRIVINGVDLDVFRPPSEDPAPSRPHPFTVACSSVWRPSKRLPHTVAGFLEFHRRNPDSRMLVIGPTDRLPEEPPTHPSVEYLGRLDGPAVAERLAQADAFLHMAWWDWCPNAVIEAQACGLPVICANSGGTRETLVPGTGEVIACDPDDVPDSDTDIFDPALIPPVSPDAVADAIERVAADLPARRERLARQRAWLGIARAGKEYLKFFEDLISGRVRKPWRRGFWALAGEAALRRIFGERSGKFADVLVLTTRKSFWTAPESRVFPNVLYSAQVFGHSNSRLNSLILFIRALISVLFRRPKVIVVGSAHRVALWLLWLRSRGLFRRPKVLVHNMVFFWTGLAPYADRIIVYSRKEAQHYSREVPGEDRFVFVPLPADGDFNLEPRPADPPYIFAGGSTKRDFAALIRAVEGLPIRLKIRCPSPEKLNYPGPLPANVDAGAAVPLQQFLQEMEDAVFVVVPLEATDLPHGHMTIAQAMRLGKAVITTAGASVDDYIIGGEEGLLVEPGDADGYRQAIMELLRNEDRRRQFETRALEKSARLFTYGTYRKALVRLCNELLRATGDFGSCQGHSEAEGETPA